MGDVVTSVVLGPTATLLGVGSPTANFILGVTTGDPNYLTAYLINQTIPKPPKIAGSPLSTDQGEDVPQQFPFGYTATAGSLVWRASWGQDGKTPNAYLTEVYSLSDIPVGGMLSLWDGEKYCHLGSGGKGEVDTDLGYPLSEYQVGSVTKKSYLWVKFYDGTQTEADVWMVSKFGTSEHPWTSSRVGYGRAYAIVTYRKNEDLFKSGKPSLLFVVNGAKLYDPRKDTTAGGSGAHRWSMPSTWETTNNPQVVRYNLRRGVYYAGKWVVGLQNMSARRLPFSNWVAAMNDCDTEIEESPGVTVAQYRCGGTIKCNSEPAGIDESLLKSCNARHIDVGGVYKTTTGVIGSSVLSITDADFVITEEQKNDQYVGIADTINGVTATYPDPDSGWEDKEAPALKDTDLAANDGRECVSDVQYECVPYPGQVQRLMQSALAETRRWRFHTGVMPHMVGASGIQPGDCIDRTSARNGYVAKKFRIDSMRKLSNLDWFVTVREADPADYDWDPDADYVAPTNGFTTPIVVPPQAVVGLTVEARVSSGADGSSFPCIHVTWDTDDIDDVIGINYIVRTDADDVVVARGRLTPFSVDPAAEAFDGFISENICGGTTYECKFSYEPGTPRDCPWSSWYIVMTAETVLPDGSVGSEELKQEVNDAVATANTNAVQVASDLAVVVQQLVDADAGNAANIQQITQSLVSQTDAMQAEYLQQFETITTTLAAYAYAVQAVQAVFGANYSSALLRMEVQTPPAGYLAKISLSAAGSVDGETGFGGLAILLKNVGGQIVSTIALIANQTLFVLPSGDLIGVIDENGWLLSDRFRKGALSNGQVYSLSDGHTTKGAEDTTTEPPDGTEVAIGSGQSVPYYDSRILTSDGIRGYKTNPAANLVEVEAHFVFRVQTGAGTSVKSGIEYYNGGAFAFVPDSDDVVYTSNTNALASLTPKAPLPQGTTYWRPRIWNTTGNTIWMRRMRAYETKIIY